eukprot:COSAG02_NODE_1634_length_11565_cov_4.754666_7_plen_1593_part_00
MAAAWAGGAALPTDGSCTEEIQTQSGTPVMSTPAEEIPLVRRATPEAMDDNPTRMVNGGFEEASPPAHAGEVAKSAAQMAKLNALPVVVQWAVSAILFVAMVVWLIFGNAATGSIGIACPVDSWLIPLMAVLLAYVAAYGFFGMPAQRALGNIKPVIAVSLCGALFAWRGALLPFVIGCSANSFLIILVVFNSAVTVPGPGGKGIADLDFAAYRGYVSLPLTVANGFVNALGWLAENEWGLNPRIRWPLFCFLLPVVMLIPAMKNMASGEPNGQYNVPDNATFYRLFISTRLGIYFAMYFLVHYHFEAIILDQAQRMEFDGTRWILSSPSDEQNAVLLTIIGSAGVIVAMLIGLLTIRVVFCRIDEEKEQVAVAAKTAPLPVQMAKLNALPVVVQWAVSAILFVAMVVWLIFGNAATGSIGIACPVDSWLIPLMAVLLAYVAAYGFFGMPAQRALGNIKPVIAVSLCGALFAWRGALLPFVIGCSANSFLIILVVFNSAVTVPGPGGKGIADLDFAAYRGYVSLPLTVANGFVNALGWLAENEWGLNPRIRWPLFCFLLPVVMLIPAMKNMASGEPNGQYNVPDNATFYRLFISTRLGIYFAMYFLVHYHFEAIILDQAQRMEFDGTRWILSSPSDEQNQSVNGTGFSPVEPAAMPILNGTDAEPQFSSEWEAQVGWSLTVLYILYHLTSEKRGVQLISCPFKSIDGNSALIREGYGGPDELLPLEKRKQYGSSADNIRPASVFRWCYWHMGVIAGALWMASSLPEVLIGLDGSWLTFNVNIGGANVTGCPATTGRLALTGPPWTHSFFLWYKLILGLGMVSVHTDMLAGRTIVGNISYIKPSARGQPKLTDAEWRMRKTICQMVQVFFVWGPMSIYFLTRSDNNLSKQLSDFVNPSTDEYVVGKRPWILNFFDGLAILIVFMVNIVRFLAYVGAKNSWFWIVRDLRHAERSSVSGEIEQMWEFGFETWLKSYGRGMRKEARTEGFVRLIATPSADTNGLGERLNRRRDGDPSWLKDPSDPTRDLEQSEVVESAMRILEVPKTLIVDNHTLIFLFLAQTAVKGGRTKCILLKDIKRPFPKTQIDTILGLVAGIEFAKSDEFYSEDMDNLAIDFKQFPTGFALWRVGHLTKIDTPRWFDSELEAVVLLESTLRNMLPPVVGQTWAEMSSDDAMSSLAFYSLGQVYLLGRSAWEKQREIGMKSGGPPKDAKQRCKYYATLPGCGSVVAAELPPGVDVPTDTAFVLDLSMMRKYELRPNFALYGSCAFFGQDKQLLAIYNCESGKLVLPPADAGSIDPQWENAKFGMRVAIISLATLREHLMYCHWIVSNRVHIASRSELDADHPVRRLLKVFTFRSGSINYTSTVTLMQENMLLHRASPFTLTGVLDAFEDAAATWRYETFPETVQAKEIADGVSLPYLEDGLEVWQCYQKFFTAYVELYYGEGKTGEDAVANDVELKAYFASLEKVSNVRWQGETGEEYELPGEPFDHEGISAQDREWKGKYNGYGYTRSGGQGLDVCNKTTLINHLCHTAFWVTAQHEVFGNIVEFFESPTFCATKQYKVGPDGEWPRRGQAAPRRPSQHADNGRRADCEYR